MAAAEELAQHYNSWLVAPFFRKSLYGISGFKQLKQRDKERFHQQGLEVEVRFVSVTQFKTPILKDQLARDLLAAESGNGSLSSWIMLPTIN